MAKRKFAELELSLLHLQQNVEIPEVHLAVHPIVRATVERCQTSGRKVHTDEVHPASVLGDSSFLNRLQSDVNSWVREVQTVTKLDRDVASGTASQEINFWLSMEHAQESIEQQLRSDPINLTLDILRNGKRFHAIVSFIADMGLKDCAEKVRDYNNVLKDFPLNGLLSATDLGKCRDAVYAIFSHFNKKLKIAPYPVKRALALVEAISRDLNETLVKILSSQRLMYQEFPSFCDIIAATNEIFLAWDESMKEFVNIAREVTRKRQEKFIPIKVNPEHAQLRDRLNYIAAFRKTHEQLRVMVSSGKSVSLVEASAIAKPVERRPVQSLAGIEMSDEITEAYESVKVIDVLDVTQEGTEIWSAAEQAYNERVSRVENTLIARLRDLLGQAKSAREMLRVLSQFNSLFVRPKVRGAVQEYQQQLLQSVKTDIQALHDKFKAQYKPSKANHLSQLRDVPEIAGAIIWARQIEGQLEVYMKRVEDVLGKGWELYAEGQRLHSESETFKRKLSTRPLFEGWLQDIQRREMSISGRLFNVTRNRATNTYDLVVNFDAQVISLFKEVRNLIWLGFQIPHGINNLAKDAKRVYPHAVSMMETVRTYNQTCGLVLANPGIARLVAQVQADVQALITQGLSLRWEHFANSYESHRVAAYLPGSGGVDHRENKQVTFVRQFATAVSLFQERATELVEMQREIDAVVDELSGCPYDYTAFADRLSKIQGTIDRLNLEGYPNLDEWVSDLDQQIEKVLVNRLRLISAAWCSEFVRSSEGRHETSGNSQGSLSDITRSGKRKNKEAFQRDKALRLALERDHVEIKPLRHEIKLQNQIIYLDPPVQSARARWFQQLHDVFGVVCGLQRIVSARYEIGLQMRTDADTKDRTYTSLLTTPFGDDTLIRPFLLIEAKVEELDAYTSRWLQFQSLWDLDEGVGDRVLGDSLTKWQDLLQGIRKARTVFDNSETHFALGTLASVEYGQVAAKVNAKYDALQRMFTMQFASKLGNSMRDVHAAISKARNDLEHGSIEASSTASTVNFVMLVEDTKRKIQPWGKQVEIFSSGEKILQRQRHTFPSEWLWVDQVDGQYSALGEILARKDAGIQEQRAGLELKILAEDKLLAERLSASLEAWEAEKPIDGQSTHERSLSTLADFETRFNKLVDDRALVVRAKDALSITASDATDPLEPVLEELRDLKGVWTALSGIWQQLDELRALKWSNVPASRKLRQQLDGLLEQTKALPARMRQYAAAEHCASTLRDLLKTLTIISELNGDAMRDRHWRMLWKRLGKGHFTTSTLTLGAVWDLGPKKNETVIKEIVAIAAGEAACETFLRETRESWTSYTLDIVRRGEAYLVRHFENLFTLAGDHLSALRQMSMSPHYKTFEEEARGLTERLERVLELFEVYADAQTRYVYLAGIFHGSTEIRAILPAESNRFQSVEAEFVAVMRKVNKSPFVFDVIGIPGVLRTLERQADLLTKIQKALGEFLERQRSMTPRLYFLGDSDLLQLIGSKDIANISSSLGKMFGGIAAIETHGGASGDLTAIVSREGERVPLKNTIALSNAKVNEWLAHLESEMRATLAALLEEALMELRPLCTQAEILPADDFIGWVHKTPAQLSVLAVQILWTELIEADLKTGQKPDQPLAIVLRGLEVLADTVLQADLQPLLRRKAEGLVTELVLQRDLSRELLERRTSSVASWDWQRQMRFYHTSDKKVEVYMADAKMAYAWEYLGAPDRLVTTPLTLRAFSVLTQARNAKMGSSLFGPAGTGKTESAKALSARLGQMSIVVNCDESFDLPAMGRIFIGLCRVGASACFDEFNRLSEAVLSAVSQQIQTIQGGLAASTDTQSPEIDLGGKTFRISKEVAINITTNPTYAGRSALPINLKKLFRSVAMTHPDRELIAQVMLFSQGFRTSEALASKIVPFFTLCSEQLSPQPHYDFGLRALKAVLVSAGQLKRDRLEIERSQRGESEGAAVASSEVAEQEILIQSITETIVPKLVGDDVVLLASLLQDVFPRVAYKPANLDNLMAYIDAVCTERHLVCEGQWRTKLTQLFQIQKISHGLMLVGPSGTGKSQAWQVLLAAMQRLDGIESASYVIDPKAISKENLYGTLDPTTREWNDGLFTSILRKIVDNARGESSKRHWIIFDGDVDPEWVENLNSVLDDNKLLTLPNGERLSLPSNVRIVFEVENLKYATLATVSRCGMIWFSDDSVTTSMICQHFLESLRTVPLGSDEDDNPGVSSARLQAVAGGAEIQTSPVLQIQQTVASVMAPFFDGGDSLVALALKHAADQDHIMDFTIARALGTLFSLINKTIRNIVEYNNQHSDFPLSPDVVDAYTKKRLLIAIVWAFTGDSKLEVRAGMGNFLREQTSIDLPPLGPGVSLIDFDVHVNSADWFSWTSKVPSIEVETAKVASADVVIPTMDTVRHEEVLYSWLSEHKPLMLCGPPGSGKTMTLFSALRKLPDQEVVGLNFSSATTPELILKTFDQYCEYRKTPNGPVLAPIQLGKWMVLFCDEINLPALDKYGTQRVISFLRQLVERGGFWRPSDKVWVRLERIQFVGACNPPTDPGRVPLTHRFLRHAPLVMVDYPGEVSLNQIYGTFNRALLKVTPNLRGYAESLTSAMVDFYLASQRRFTPDQQAHYVYSPRELTRWMRGIYEAIKPLDDLDLDGLVRVWAYEGLRLFQDRLVFEAEKQWTDSEIDATARQHFPNVSDRALARPMLFSNWLTKETQSVDQEALRRHTTARLAQYSEEELDIQKLVLHDSVLDIATCIDRVLRQRQGHVLLIGVSGSGRATLTRFVAWLNGLSVFTIASSNRYSMADFNEDLKGVLRRSGTQGEKLCFMIDESQIKDPAFLEAMNTLLANAEVPGLFEGDEYGALMTACKEGSQRDGLMLDSPEELYGWFQSEISRNLHVVFTMNPPAQGGMGNRAAASPALFNRTTIVFT